MTTVACVWVRGEVDYGVEYVTRLRSMVERFMDRPFDFVCLTDRPDEIRSDGILAIRVQKLPGFAPWTKLELFNPARGFPGRVLYLDLDSLIVAPLAPILDMDATFAITDDPPVYHVKARRTDAYGRLIVRRFNSSVMVWDAGMMSSLYTEFRPTVAAKYSGDQDWIGHQVPAATPMPREWFPRLSEVVEYARSPQAAPWPQAAKVILAKVPKNREAAAKYPWFAEAWG